MRPLGEALAARGFPVHAVCLAGDGTDLASLARARWADWFASVSEGLARLRPEAPRIAIAGMSLGGLLALHLAATHPAAVAALVLCGTPIQLSGARIRWLPILARLPFVARHYATIPKVNGKPDIADPVMRAASQSYPAVPLPAVLELLRLQALVRRERQLEARPAAGAQGALGDELARVGRERAGTPEVALPGRGGDDTRPEELRGDPVCRTPMVEQRPHQGHEIPVRPHLIDRAERNDDSEGRF